jgi:hypothetical protein
MKCYHHLPSVEGVDPTAAGEAVAGELPVLDGEAVKPQQQQSHSKYAAHRTVTETHAPCPA